MASFLDRSCLKKIISVPKRIENPPFCWIVRAPDGSFILTEDDCLLIFKSCDETRKFIDEQLLTGCTPKQFFWDVLVENLQGLVKEAILDQRDGTYISFPLIL